MELLAAAVAENASWCALVSGWSGVSWHERRGLTLAAGPPPPWFPGAVTLKRGVAIEDVAATQPAVIKDSYAELDLAALGYVPLFDAEWIGRAAGPAQTTRWRAVRAPADLARWRAAHGSADAIVTSALDEPTVAVLALPGEPPAGGAVAHLEVTSGVIGLSNVFGDVGWDELAAAARHRFGPRPLVGYERGLALASARAGGFAELGPLRVWARPG